MEKEELKGLLRLRTAALNRVVAQVDTIAQERNELKRKLERILMPHEPRDWCPLDGPFLGGKVCNQCRTPWPCQVIRAAEREE